MARSARPPLWLAIIIGLVLLVGVAWALGGGPDGQSDVPTGGGATTDAVAARTASDGGTTTATTRTPRATSEPRITRERRAMARLARHNLQVRAGGGRSKLVALTFDDGPGPDTMATLRELNRLKVPSTFFMLGQLVRYHPDTVKAIVRHGHEVAIHTWSHPDITTLSRTELENQIFDTRAALRRYAGVEPGLFRPPYGSINDRVVRQLRPARLVHLLWDVDTRDWTGLSSQEMVDMVLATATGGSVVLMHDGGGNRSQTVGAIDGIVTGLRAKGYEFTTASRLLMEDPPLESLPAPASTAPLQSTPTPTAPDGSAPPELNPDAPTTPVSSPSPNGEGPSPVE